MSGGGGPVGHPGATPQLGWGLFFSEMSGTKKNSASAWRATMTPRQLLLELEEVDMAAEKGSKRVRVDSADDYSMQ
eukprot:scaffold19454_cov124-Isochrysis_galbana.AAC.2